MKLAEIKLKLATILAQFTVVKTDKAVLQYDGDELKAGMNVYVENENGEKAVAEDGEYTTEDKKVIIVKDGIVESIIDPIAEVDAEDVVEQPNEEVETKTEEMVEETTTEVKEETETESIENLRKEVNELYKLVDSILDKIGETRQIADERLSKLEQMSIAKPIVEEMESVTKLSKIGDNKLEKQMENIRKMNQDWRNM